MHVCLYYYTATELYIYMYSICTYHWVSMSEPHLIMLMCESTLCVVE